MTEPSTWVKGGRISSRASIPRAVSTEPLRDPLRGSELSLAGPFATMSPSGGSSGGGLRGPSSGRTEDLYTTRERRRVGAGTSTTSAGNLRRMGSGEGSDHRSRAEAGMTRDSSASAQAETAVGKVDSGAVPRWVRLTSLALMGVTVWLGALMLLDPPVAIEPGTRYRSYAVDSGWFGLPLTSARQKDDVLLLTVAPEWLKASPEWHMLRVAHLTRHLMGREGVERIVILDPTGTILSDVSRDALSVELAPRK